MKKREINFKGYFLWWHKTIGGRDLSADEWINIQKKYQLKDLDEHNTQGSNMQGGVNSDMPTWNGIACPKCGEELYDSFPMVTLTSWPAKKNVHCSKCGYVGYRTA